MVLNNHNTIFVQSLWRNTVYIWEIHIFIFINCINSTYLSYTLIQSGSAEAIFFRVCLLLDLTDDFCFMFYFWSFMFIFARVSFRGADYSSLTLGSKSSTSKWCTVWDFSIRLGTVWSFVPFRELFPWKSVYSFRDHNWLRPFSGSTEHLGRVPD